LFLTVASPLLMAVRRIWVRLDAEAAALSLVR
jgi:hypothetical protein